MTRREPITAYFSESEKAEITQEAEQAEKTVSTYCRELIQQKRRENAQEELEGTLNAEKRIEAIIVEGLDNMQEIASTVETQNWQIIDALTELYAVEIEQLDSGEPGDNDPVDTADGGSDDGTARPSLEERLRGDRTDNDNDNDNEK